MASGARRGGVEEKAQQDLQQGDSSFSGRQGPCSFLFILPIFKSGAVSVFGITDT